MMTSDTGKRHNEIEHLRNMTDEEAHANALSDPDAQPLANVPWGAQWKDAVRLHDLPGETILEKLQNFKQRRPKKSLTVRYDADIMGTGEERRRTRWTGALNFDPCIGLYRLQKNAY